MKRADSTVRDDSSETTIVSLISERVRRHPERLAVLCEGRSLTYGELDGLSNQVARLLLREVSCGPERLVGICLGRSEWMLICILAILKTGSAYVPLDPSYPAERIHYLLTDSRAGAVLSEESLDGLFRDFSIPRLSLEKISSEHAALDSSSLRNRIDARHLAYIIYTSGTTGPPKGVMIEHRGLTNVVLWSVDEFAESRYSTVFAGSSECFDLSVFEFFFPLVAGKHLRILSNITIPLYLKKHRDVMLNTVPSLIRALVKKPGILNEVRAINLVGEALPYSLYRDLCRYRDLEIRNIYGTTETTIHAINRRLGRSDEGVPIGLPIANTSAQILDIDFRRVPQGTKGEILLGGAGLARGYLGRPALTAERFLPDPNGNGERLYKTGDLGSRREDGEIDCHGRLDDQIKIKGFRIEPGEICSFLDRHSQVKGSVVLAGRGASELNELVAFVSSDDRKLRGRDLRRFLADKLPRHLIPRRFVILRELPVARTGKVDREALLARA